MFSSARINGRHAYMICRAFAGSLRPSEYAELAGAAELAGFDVFSVFGDLMFQPPIPALLMAAQATRRIRLGPAAMNPYTTHPVEIAGQVAFLDLVSSGRAYLGLARGAWLERLDVPQPQPLAAIRDAADIVRRLLSGDDSGHAAGVESDRQRVGGECADKYAGENPDQAHRRG